MPIPAMIYYDTRGTNGFVARVTPGRLEPLALQVLRRLLERPMRPQETARRRLHHRPSRSAAPPSSMRHPRGRQIDLETRPYRACASSCDCRSNDVGFESLYTDEPSCEP